MSMTAKKRKNCNDDCIGNDYQDEHKKRRAPAASEPAALVLLDAETGEQVRITDASELRRYKSPKVCDKKAPAVIAAVEQALRELPPADDFSEASLARIAAAVYKYCLRYDYCAGEWCYAKGKSQAKGKALSDFQCDSADRSPLLCAVGSVLWALMSMRRFPPAVHSVLMGANSVLDYNCLLRDRIAHRMEHLMLWHAPPPPPHVSEQCRASVRDWLDRARTSGRLTRRRSALPRSLADCESSPPAMVSDLWNDFAAAHHDAAAELTDEQFVLLLAASARLERRQSAFHRPRMDINIRRGSAPAPVTSRHV